MATSLQSPGLTASAETHADRLNLIRACGQRGAFVTVLDPHVSTWGEMGHIVLTVPGMVAQMERRSIKLASVGNRYRVGLAVRLERSSKSTP
jgi:hypothetical protein